jgi:FKBP-type peptidyl-prolyl cis-trans isomerase
VQLDEQETQPSQQSQRGDVLGIIYEAHLDSPTGRIYDASYQRGTGQQPYQMVLGSGDMIIGVDQGLYDMCINEIRGIYIPSRLAYSTRGNHNFVIPPNTNLYWKVQLIRID